MLTLDDRASADVSVAGAKAARLAQALHAGFPVLPGLVVPAVASRGPLADAYARVAGEGAHGAQLAVMAADTTGLADLPDLAGRLGDTLVVRSSSPWEGAGHWSGAFTSYLDVPAEHVLTAVRGVWASALSRDALERSGHVGVVTAPEIAVLVQPQQQPDFAGTATLEPEGAVTVVAVAGSPVPLLHGWEPGWVSYRTAAGVVGGDLGELGDDLVHGVADLVTAVARQLGDDRIEWASVGGRLLLLQSSAGASTPAVTPPATGHAGVPADAPATADEMLNRADGHAERARAEAFAYTALMEHGEQVTGVPAAPGVCAGPVAFVEGLPTDTLAIPERVVLVAPRPLPHLAPLLWGASGLVTFGGSPAAHLVEVARSLNLPVVVGCRSAEPVLRVVEEKGLVAVDGDHGVVSTWARQ